MGSVPLVTSFTDTRNLATFVFFGGCLVLTYKVFTDFEVSSREAFSLAEKIAGLCGRDEIELQIIAKNILQRGIFSSNNC